MSAEELLRRYLEQRRELGEQELVLDGMSVEDVMRIIGVRPAGMAPSVSPEHRASDRLPRPAQSEHPA
ncbi:MAG TPA: hypothetical protein VFJ96_12335, partial [Gemmatimonadaceae bacterium]|nr:hypothetical protein [Gemmatimonadaceae bacterium]